MGGVLSKLFAYVNFAGDQVYYHCIEPFVIHPPPNHGKAMNWWETGADLCCKITDLCTHAMTAVYNALRFVLKHTAFPLIDPITTKLFGTKMWMPYLRPPTPTPRAPFVPMLRFVVYSIATIVTTYFLAPAQLVSFRYPLSYYAECCAVFMLNHYFGVWKLFHDYNLQQEIRQFEEEWAANRTYRDTRKNFRQHYYQDARNVRDYMLMTDEERRELRERTADFARQPGEPYPNEWRDQRHVWPEDMDSVIRHKVMHKVLDQQKYGHKPDGPRTIPEPELLPPTFGPPPHKKMRRDKKRRNRL